MTEPRGDALRMLFSTAVICPFCCLTRRPSWRLHRCGKQLSHPMEKLSAGHTTGGGGDSGPRRRRIELKSQDKRARLTRVIPREPTLLRLYLAHFFPVFPRFLRVFTVSPRRFQRAPSRNPGPRNSRQASSEAYLGGSASMGEQPLQTRDETLFSPEAIWFRTWS